MPRYIAALNKPPLQKTDDICLTAEDSLKGESAVQKIQANMFSFFMNIMPMATAYPNWRSAGTVEMISDYLTNRLLEDLKEKQILGSFYELIPFIRLVYPHTEGDEKFNKNPIILDSASPIANTKSIVKATYIGMLNNISETSEYKNVNLSSFDPSDNLGRIKLLYGEFFKKIHLSDDITGYFPNRQNITDAGEVLENCYDGRTNKATDLGMLLGTYYFPIAFQVASYMIYLDRGIKYSERYDETNYRMLVEESSTNDAMLTSIKGQLVDEFSKSHRGFPIPVDGFRGNPIKYFGTFGVRRRIKELRRLLQTLTSEEGFQELGYLPLLNREGPARGSLLTLQSADLGEVFPDFFSTEALLDAPPLYINRRTPSREEITQTNGIQSQTKYLVATWLDSIRRLFLDDNDYFNRETTARSQITLPFSSPRYPFQGPPNRNPLDLNNPPVYLYDYLVSVTTPDINPHDRRSPTQLRNLVRINGEKIVNLVENYNSQFGEQSYALEPTQDTNDLYFLQLGEIFSRWGSPVHSAAVDESLATNPHLPLINGETPLYPYYIWSRPGSDEPGDGGGEAIKYLYNQIYGNAYRFFNQYLYNKYFGYADDKAKILEEINTLENLITRNE
tara:strand:- start:4638 stop:6494 length:1857 start_codon:yes stop_codon:yes gene_type:complete